MIKNLATGIYRFNKPESAYVEEPFRIVLALATAEGQNVSGLFSGTPGNVEERRAPFARYLQATLRGGPDFTVVPPDPQPRTATTSAPVVWEWTVVPLRPGNKALVIDVAAVLLVGSQKEVVQLQTLSEEIRIKVGSFAGSRAPSSAPWESPSASPRYSSAVWARSTTCDLGASPEAPPCWCLEARCLGRAVQAARGDLAASTTTSLDRVPPRQRHASPRDRDRPFRHARDSLIEVARQQGWLIELCDALAAARSGNAPVSSAILAVRQSLTDHATRATQPAVTSG